MALLTLRNGSPSERVVHLPHDRVCAALGDCLCSRQTRTRSVLRAVRDGVKERSTEASVQRFPATLTLLPWKTSKPVPDAYLKAPELTALIDAGAVFADPVVEAPAPEKASPLVTPTPVSASDTPTGTPTEPQASDAPPDAPAAESPKDAVDEPPVEPTKATTEGKLSRPRRAGSEG